MTPTKEAASSAEAQAGASNNGDGGVPAADGQSDLINRLRRSVEALVAIDRRATRPGEARSATWVASELESAGISEVEQTGRAVSTWAWISPRMVQRIGIRAGFGVND